jgi:hypothetical protein
MKYANTHTKNGIETVATVLPLEMVPDFDPENPPQDNTYAVPDEVEVGWIKADGEFVPPPDPEPELVLQWRKSAVQARLDAFAATRDYRGIEGAVSYQNDPDPVWAAEAQCCIELRSETWHEFFAVMDAVHSGEREMPTAEELFAELPQLEWPE